MYERDIVEIELEPEAETDPMNKIMASYAFLQPADLIDSKRDKLISSWPHPLQMRILSESPPSVGMNDISWGPIHDLSRLGSLETQIKIIDNPKFDTVAFASEYGTPPDIVAVWGHVEAQGALINRMRGLESMDAMAARRLHRVATSAERVKSLNLLDLPQKMLRAENTHGEGLYRRIHSLSPELAELVRTRDPFWNHDRLYREYHQRHPIKSKT